MVEQHRLALVLNGGVSLAIWMGGVSYEIDLVRRLSDPSVPQPQPSGAERDVLDAWREACQGKPRLRVDVIAGTSAGGLNGVFLAAAIARGGSLAPLKSLWMDRAQFDLDNLLKPRATVNSLLNGDFFLEQVGKGLGAISWVGDGQEVTLVTTASAVGGPPRRFRDSRGALFRLQDHRRRYRFRRGPAGYTYAGGGAAGSYVPKDPVDDFGDKADAAEALSLAGRATAAIPGVFDPVEETDTLRAHRRLPLAADDSPKDWLLDGGLLDDAPFDAMLDAIAKQSVGSTWTRSLAYIVPTAADPDEAPAEPEASGLPPWTTVVPKLYSYPGESNLRDGIERLDAMLTGARPEVDAGRFTALLKGGDLDGITATAAGLFGYYQAARASAGVAEARETASLGAIRWLRPPRWEDVGSVIPDSPSWLPSSPPFTPGEPWYWGFAAADRVVRLILRSIRELRGPVQDDRRKELHILTEQVHAVRVAVRDELVKLPIEDASAEAVGTALTRLYDQLGVPAALSTIVGQAAGIAAAAWPATAADVLRAALSLEIINGAPGLPVDYTPTPIFDFRRFDVRVPPNVFGFEVAGKDPADLLYGTRLSHFAAFADRDWRRWDWMWGRISATIHLCDLLEVPAEQAEKIIRAIVAAERFTITKVDEQAAPLLDGTSETSTKLFRQIRKRGMVGLAADALLQMGGSPAVTAPPVPALARTAGAVLSAAAARPAVAPGERRSRPLLRRPAMWLLGAAAKRLFPAPRPSQNGGSSRLTSAVHRLLALPRMLLWGWLDP